MEGILVGRDAATKLVISIQLIQRSLAVSVYNFDVEPVRVAPARPSLLRKESRSLTLNTSASIIPAPAKRRMRLAADSETTTLPVGLAL